MREIKFRAWNGKEMIDNWISVHKRDEQVIDDITLPISYFPSFNLSSVVAYMQYTGLKDKNGVEIYEGDILKATRINKISKLPANSVVFWMDSHGMFEHKWDDGSNHTDTKEFWINEPLYVVACTFSTFCEVIGNIYQNPELIKP